MVVWFPQSHPLRKNSPGEIPGVTTECLSLSSLALPSHTPPCLGSAGVQEGCSQAPGQLLVGRQTRDSVNAYDQRTSSSENCLNFDSEKQIRLHPVLLETHSRTPAF